MYLPLHHHLRLHLSLFSFLFLSLSPFLLFSPVFLILFSFSLLSFLSSLLFSSLFFSSPLPTKLSTIVNFPDKTGQKTKINMDCEYKTDRSTKCWLGSSTVVFVSCVMKRCPQHDNTTTMLTLNTRTRRRVELNLSSCSRFDGSTGHLVVVLSTTQHHECFHGLYSH